MIETFKESENRIETLVMYKVLEGLIHNINTPLNLIIGYSQQLKKQYPEISNLDKINNAGLKIDEIVQACSRQMITRLQPEIKIFDLKQWLLEEVKLLNNILDIKHKLQFKTILPEDNVMVKSSQLMLGLFLESLLLHLKNSLAAFSGDNTISLSILINNQYSELILQLPPKITDISIDSYLSNLQAELQNGFNIKDSINFPFNWQCNQNQEIKIILQVIGL